jgi:cell division protein FtsB
MTDFFNIVGTFGFPVAVASYLLFRFEKKLEVLAQCNEKLRDEIVLLKDVVIKDLKEQIIKLTKQIVDLKKEIVKKK